MYEIKVEITYNNQSFVFDGGLKAYLFYLGVKLGFNVENGEITRFIEKTFETRQYPIRHG